MDISYAAWLADNQVPFCLVFTKIDRRKKGMSNKESNMAQFKRELLKVDDVRLFNTDASSATSHIGKPHCTRMQDFEYLPPSIATSAADGTGKGQMLHFIGSLRVAAESTGGRKG